MRLNPRRSSVLALVGLVLPVVAMSAAPQALTTEYRVDPVGIDAERPRLSWRLPEGVQHQTAYEIEAGEWRTGKVTVPGEAAIWIGPGEKKFVRKQ